MLKAEAVAADAPALWLLASAARGSMRDALSLTDQAIAFGSGELTEGTVRQMLGSADRSHVLALVEALAGVTSQTAGGHSLSNGLRSSRNVIVLVCW